MHEVVPKVVAIAVSIVMAKRRICLKIEDTTWHSPTT